ncbi:hypothetical protein Tco_0323208 [Tanacetum coccineum]
MMAMPFNEGSFSIRYLGIPLDANRICRDDCKVLLDNIMKRIKDWRNKSLSFTRRIQLIYFKTEGKKGIKHSVAWKEVCMQKSECGLGLRSTHAWNEALMAKHLWNVIVNKESIWVKLVKTHYLIDNSIWDVEPSHHASWVWKQILALKDNIRSFVKFKIGDGRKYFFLFDSWYEKGPLCKLINYNVLMQDRYILKTKVTDLIIDGVWRWPQDWNIRRLWERLKGMAKLEHVPDSWAQIISSIVNMPASNTIWSVIQRLVLGASVHYIWIVFESVRLRLVGLKLKATPDVIKAAEVWNFPIDKMSKYKIMIDNLLSNAMDIDDES